MPSLSSFFFFLLLGRSEVLKAVEEWFKQHASFESSDSKPTKRTRHSNAAAWRKCENSYLQGNRRSTTADKAEPRKPDPKSDCLTPIKYSGANGICQAFTNAGKACRNRVKQTNYCYAHSRRSKLADSLPRQPPSRKQTTGVQCTWEKLWVPGVDGRGKYIYCDGSSFSCQSKYSSLVKVRLDSGWSKKSFGMYANTS